MSPAIVNNINIKKQPPLPKPLKELPPVSNYAIPIDSARSINISGAAKNTKTDLLLIKQTNDPVLKEAYARTKAFIFVYNLIRTVMLRAEDFSDLSPVNVIIPDVVKNTLDLMKELEYPFDIQLTEHNTIKNILVLAALLPAHRLHMDAEFNHSKEQVNIELKKAKLRKDYKWQELDIDINSIKMLPFVLVTDTLIHDVKSKLNNTRLRRNPVGKHIPASIKNLLRQTSTSTPSTSNVLSDTKKQITTFIDNDKARHQNQKLFSALRYKVMTVNGNYCSCCGKQPGDKHDNNNLVKMTGDHIMPFAKHHELRLNILNIQILCDECNTIKDSTDFTDWRTNTQKDNLIKLVYNYSPTNDIERDLIIMHFTFKQTQRSIANKHQVSYSLVSHTFKKLKSILIPIPMTALISVPTMN